MAGAVQAAMQAQAEAGANGSRTPPTSPGGEPTNDTDPSWCARHTVTMTWHDGNARGPGWFSHRLADGSYCKGKWLLLDSRVVAVPRLYHPTSVTLSFWHPFFFNGLQKA